MRTVILFSLQQSLHCASHLSRLFAASAVAFLSPLQCGALWCIHDKSPRGKYKYDSHPLDLSGSVIFLTMMR